MCLTVPYQSAGMVYLSHLSTSVQPVRPSTPSWPPDLPEQTQVHRLHLKLRLGLGCAPRLKHATRDALRPISLRPHCLSIGCFARRAFQDGLCSRVLTPVGRCSTASLLLCCAPHALEQPLLHVDIERQGQSESKTAIAVISPLISLPTRGKSRMSLTKSS